MFAIVFVLFFVGMISSEPTVDGLQEKSRKLIKEDIL